MASCGKCGYQVRGISTLNCPECGADLREVGIVKGKSSKVMVWVAVAVGVGVVLIGLCVCSGFILFNAKSSSFAPVTTPMAPMPRPVPQPVPDSTTVPEQPDSRINEDSDLSPEDTSGATQSPVEK